MKVHANLPCLRRKTKTPKGAQLFQTAKWEQEQKVPVFMFPIRNLTILLLFCFPWAAPHPTVPALEAKRKGYGYAVQCW